MTRTIAYVDHAEEIGGAEKSLCELISQLDRDRWDPLVLHRPGAKWLPYAEEAGAQLCGGIPASALYAARRDELGGGPANAARRLLGAVPVVGGIWRTLRKIRPSLVHTNSTKMHLLAGAAARLPSIPVIWHMRDLMADPDAQRWLRRAVEWVRPQVIAISDAVAAQFEGMPCPVHVVPNGVPLDRFSPGPAPEGLREDLGLEDGAPVATIVGRLTPWKGHRVLLQAWPFVVKRVPEARLLIVGEVAFWEDSYGDELQVLADELGVSNSVIRTGFREDIPDLLRVSDLLVLASEAEPFGRVLIEAMGTGLPVVATASGGVPEIVVDRETGLLVPVGEPEPLADSIAQLLSSPEMARTMGVAGRERALRCFDIQRVAHDVSEIYRKILGA